MFDKIKFKITLLKSLIDLINESIQNNTIEYNYNYPKNKDTYRRLRRSHGITEEIFEEEITEAASNLKIEDYSQGPEADDKPYRGFVFWMFGKIIFETIEIYLKFRTDNEPNIECWSFHIPDKGKIINYPFKK